MKEIHLNKNEFNKFMYELESANANSYDVTFYTDDPIFYISKLSDNFTIDEEGEKVFTKYKKLNIEADEEKIVCRVDSGKRNTVKTIPGEGGGEVIKPVITVKEM